MENSPAQENKEKIFVLHVDDEEDFLFLTKEYVESATKGEINFDYLSKPQEIFEKLDTRQYDVIVCDYLMPEMDGLDLISQLEKKNYDIPFIIFTGRSREEVVIEALNLGADYYIKKGADTKSQYTELIHHAQQPMEQLHQIFNENVILAVLSNYRLKLIDRIQSTHIFRSFTVMKPHLLRMSQPEGKQFGSD